MEAAQTNKETIERMCRAAGMMPETRGEVAGYDLLIADGFSLPPHKAFGRFGVTPDDYPQGCYVTFWWLMKGEDRLFLAVPLIFDAMHDPHWDKDTKKRARINRARQSAHEMVEKLRNMKGKVH